MERNTMSYKARQFLMFAGPALILFCMVIIIPFVYGLYLTFTSWDGVSASKPFVGIANYVSAFKDYYFWSAIGRTLIYSAFAVIFVNIVAFVLAYLVTSGVKGQNFFRAGFFIPNLIGGIVLGYVWKFVFNVCGIHDADLCCRLHERSRQPQGSGYDRRLHSEPGDAQRYDPSDEKLICYLPVPEHHQMLHGLRCQPVLDERRAVQLFRYGGHACL